MQVYVHMNAACVLAIGRRVIDVHCWVAFESKVMKCAKYAWISQHKINTNDSSDRTLSYRACDCRSAGAGLQQ